MVKVVVEVLVLMGRIYLLHSAVIVLVNIISSVRELEKRFVLQTSSNVMALIIAMVQQTN